MSELDEEYAEDDELLRYEEERRLRKEVLNRFAGKIVAVVCALGFALLSYDSGRAAATQRAHPLTLSTQFGAEHESWMYPAVISALSGLVAVAIVAVVGWLWLRRRLSR